MNSPESEARLTDSYVSVSGLELSAAALHWLGLVGWVLRSVPRLRLHVILSVPSLLPGIQLLPKLPKTSPQIVTSGKKRKRLR